MVRAQNLSRVMHCREDELLVLKPSKLSRLTSASGQVAEKVLGGVIGRDAGRHNNACASAWIEQVADGFSKDGVSIDVTSGGEREAVALAKKFADAIGGVDGSDKLGV